MSETQIPQPIAPIQAFDNSVAELVDIVPIVNDLILQSIKAKMGSVQVYISDIKKELFARHPNKFPVRNKIVFNTKELMYHFNGTWKVEQVDTVLKEYFSLRRQDNML